MKNTHLKNSDFIEMLYYIHYSQMYRKATIFIYFEH